MCFLVDLKNQNRKNMQPIIFPLDKIIENPLIENIAKKDEASSNITSNN